ncbi:MAG: recombinase family protein [Planctomycetota bacterium]|nr:recombinase family protein [Planctomycetota bacterium]
MATSILTALYLRASSKDQTESIPAQRDLLTRYAADHGLEIGPEYQDFAISGDSCSGRPGLQALLADAKLGKFQAVLVRQLSRLSRRDSLKSAAQIIGPLLDAGVTVYTAANGDLRLDSATGRIMLAVLSEFDHAENVSRSMNVLNGQLRAAESGSWIGKVPYGYRIEGTKHNKVLVLADPEHVATVRRMFELYASGESCEAIARALTAENIPSVKGGTWSGDVVGSMLNNPVYVGDHRFNHTSAGKYYQLTDGKPTERRGHWDADQEKTKITKNAEDQWVYIKDHWPAITDRATWDRCQRRLQFNRDHASPAQHDLYALGGLLKCECGHPRAMHGKTITNRKYRCEQCGSWVSEAVLLEAIADTIKQSLTPDDIAELRRQLALKASKPRPVASTKALETKLAKYERRLLECSTDMLPTIEKEIRTLRRAIEEGRRDAATQAARPSGDDIERALAQLFKLPELLATASPKLLKASLAGIFDAIHVKATSTGQGTARRWTIADAEASLLLPVGALTKH